MRADEKLTAFVELEKGDLRVRGEFDLVIAALHHSLNSPACSCVSITLPASS